ncbi:hypothetical protein AeRB84_011757 [Aphanomyces euteiches]|nr:hypothetical protein AeRB84_011757 [Aphanomyces euteiches]
MRGEKRKRTPLMNDGIHPRNKYKTPPDFIKLAALYPSLKQLCVYFYMALWLRESFSLRETKTGGYVIDWTDPQATRELTKTLLHLDFGLTWNIPIDRLCPPLTNRLNYIHWIEDLILLSQPSFVSPSQESPIRGIDIGTGASCIYPLLGHALNQWHFIATDIDSISIQHASVNVDANQLGHAIHLKLVDNATMLPKDAITQSIMFTMCNPPFFDSIDEADTNPRSKCTGSSLEMTTPGGEVAFIKRMIQDSLDLKAKVRWYTSLIGRKSSLRPLLATLRESGIRNTRTTEFLQGRTTRWGIAWTFTDDGIDQTENTKVLGKRKEAQRRQDMSFRLPRKSEKDVSGCATIEQVQERIIESTMEQSTPLVKITLEAITCEDSRRVYSIVATNVEEKEVLWCSRAEVTHEQGGDGYDVTLTWVSGKARDQFWAFSDKWKSGIVRTGRRWRKKLVAPTTF